MENRRLRACIYCRVSTTKKSEHSTAEKVVFEQNPAIQEEPLRKLIENREWELASVYTDRASGAKEEREGLAEMMAAARRREFDVLVVYRLDRLARSLKQLILTLDELKQLGIAFISLKENLDTGCPAGKMMFAVIGAMAEFERDLIRERVIAGVEHARIHGTKSGRPHGRPLRIFDRARAAELRRAGASLGSIARQFGVGKATVARAVGQ